MTIKVIEGCFISDVLIDDVSIYDMSRKKFDEMLNSLIKRHSFKVHSHLDDDQILLAILELYQPVESDQESEPCDICGETVFWKVYKI